MIDDQLFMEMQDLYKENIELFKNQNTGYIIENVIPFTIDKVEKVIDIDGILIDKKYIYEHYRNFTVNPQITEIQKRFTTQIEISPDISWEIKK